MRSGNRIEQEEAFRKLEERDYETMAVR